MEIVRSHLILIFTLDRPLTFEESTVERMEIAPEQFGSMFESLRGDRSAQGAAVLVVWSIPS